MAIGNCPRCGGAVDDENEYCNDCLAQDEADLQDDAILHAAIMQDFNAAPPGFEVVKPFKVGDRVELDFGGGQLKLGRIIGSGRVKDKLCWQVHLDEAANPLEWLPILQVTNKMKHSNAPMPDKSGQLSERQKRSGRFPPTPPTPEHLEPIINTMQGFKVGDILEQVNGGILNRYEIHSIIGDNLTYARIEPNQDFSHTVSKAWLAAKIMRGEIIYKALATRTAGNQLPAYGMVSNGVDLDQAIPVQPVTHYELPELKAGDTLIWTSDSAHGIPGEGLPLAKVKVVSIDPRGFYRLQWEDQAEAEYDGGEMEDFFSKGKLRKQSISMQIAELEREADRLDTHMVETMEALAKVQEQIAALKASRYQSQWGEEKRPPVDC